MLRIGFDAKRLFHNHTGLGNYARTLLGDLAEFYPETSYHLFTPGIGKGDGLEPYLQEPFHIHHPSGSFSALWRSTGMGYQASQLRLDLFHGLSHELPMRLKLPAVVTMHDLIYKHYPEQYPWFDRQVYERKFRHACQRADVIVAISEATKADLVQDFHIKEEKIQVIYQSCDPIFRDFIPEDFTPTQDFLLPEHYFLYVGSIIPRKDLLSIVEAMALIPESHRLPLVIVGQGKRYKQEVEARARALGMMDWLIWKTGVKTADLPWYYYKAQALVYPSWREGFGIPVIESLYCQTPVITTEVSSLPEAAGPGGILVAPKSPEALAAAMQRMLDSTVREKLAEDGLGYVEEQFDPSDICEQWMFLYKNVSGRS